MTDKDSRQKSFVVRPFGALKSLKKELKRRNDGPPPSEPSMEPAEEAIEEEPRDDAQAFEEAMADVVPLKDRERVAPKVGHEGTPRAADEAAAVDAYLRDLIDGVVPFDIADTDEYIEGSVQGLDRRLIRKLRRGKYSIQGHIDLHGHDRDEARAAVGRFIRDAHERGLRCVLIVHGRGLRSKGQIPVLKEKLKAWLTRGSIGTKVLAFASAQRYDGGTGAVYVLLRR